ncbi:hypothetical protein BGZ60DRAFT_527225 [Tricladium varicosporioides]|nr:hypothetical protein BGZ60DRAFT_527225 [Hymenoscyphus varicosporioides]
MESEKEENPSLKSVANPKPGAIPPIAIRCDRRSPCGNCVDAGISCLRNRPRSGKRARDTYPKDISESINEIKTRMNTLEASVNQLVAISIKSQSEPEERASKRSRVVDGDFTTVPRSCSTFIPSPAESHTTPPFSTYEAQTLIQQEICRIPGSSTTKQAALQAALSSLKQNLNTSIVNSQSVCPKPEHRALSDFPLPHVTLLQWMLRSDDPGRSVCSSSGFMPFISRTTLGRMVRTLRENTVGEGQRTSLICATAYAGYFLQEIVLSDYGKYTGLEEELRAQALECFETAEAVNSHTMNDSASTLDILQSFIFGFLLAQEKGDFVSGLRFTEAACKLCISLDLHKKFNKFSKTPEIAQEAYYCFATCYKMDKGLAMNLARPAFLTDTEIEIDLFSPPFKEKLMDNFRIYLELAQVQGRIITDLRPARATSVQLGLMLDMLARMDNIWQIYEQITSKGATNEDLYDSELESAMVEFAFHSVKTVILHSCVERLRNQDYNNTCIEAARSALGAIQKARGLSSLSQYNSKYMRTSLLHWTILHYPFTPFFVLLCNVISTRNSADYHVMQQFVAYLNETKDISISGGKLYKLCLPFCTLASGLLASDDQIISPTARSKANDFGSKVGYWKDPTSQPLLTQQVLPNHDRQPAIFRVSPQLPHMANDMEPSWLIDGNSSRFEDQEFLWDFMDTQPVLQWLDSDFSGWDDSWNTNANFISPP